jgi:hypothetical protein
MINIGWVVVDYVCTLYTMDPFFIIKLHECLIVFGEL